MEEQKSNLVESVETSTAEKSESETGIAKEFNPLAFTEEKEMGTEETKSKDTEESEDKVSEKETKEETDEFTWDSVELDEEEDESKEEEEDENWDEEVASEKTEETTEEKTKEEPSSNGELNWNRFSEELGLEASNKDEFMKELQRVMNSYSQQQMQSAAPSNTAEQINRYLGMSNRDLVAEELKMDGMEENEVEEQLDKLDDSGLLKREAARIKRQLKNALASEKQNTQQQIQQQTAERKKSVKAAREGLQKHFKGMDEFMGGKVTKSMAQRAYKFAINDLTEQLWKNHETVADVSLFMLYKDKIKKILRSQGMEDGKASILNKITQPNLGKRGKSNYKPKSSEFDPTAFIG